MADPMIPTVDAIDVTLQGSRRKKRRKLAAETRLPIGEEQVRLGAKRWRTERERQIYSSKLFEAVRRIRQRSDDTEKISGRTREFRDIADRVLAVSARGTTRWSRAILARRVRARLRKHKKAKLNGINRSRRLPETKAERPTRTKSSGVKRKMKILGRLVPGCQKVSVPNLLEEASDYIAALEMQVRAMTALAELLASPPPSPSIGV